jgi:hypothetical protein
MALKEIFKKYWYLIIILIVLVYVLYPKYSGESSVCMGNIECNCIGYSYTTWSGPDAAQIQHCIGMVTSCNRTSEGNIMGCP